MRKFAFALACLATPLFAINSQAQSVSKAPTAPVGPVAVSGIDTARNGYLSLQQSATGADLLPTPTAGVDILEYVAGKISLVHNVSAPVPLATTASTVAKALSLAAIPTPCPVGQALSAMDAKGNAVICIAVGTNNSQSGDQGGNPGGKTPDPSLSAGPSFLYTYTQPQIQSGDIITYGTTLFASHATVPANALVVGSTIELDASGTYDITTSQEPNAGIIWIRIGGNRVAVTNFQTNLAVAKNYLWTAHFKAIVRSVGPGGTLDPLLTATSSANQYGGRVELAAFNPTQAVDTTSAASIQVELTDNFQGDSATLTQMTVTVR